MPKKSLNSNDISNESGTRAPLDKKAFIHELFFEQTIDESDSDANKLSLTQIQQYISLQATALIDQNEPIAALTDTHFTLKSQFVRLFEDTQQPLPQLVGNLIDLIDRLFHYLVIDSGLDLLVKTQLNKLRLPYLLLLIDNPKILLHKQQATRQLLNDLITAGQLWDPQDSKSEQILSQISTTVEQMLRLCNKPENFQEGFLSLAQHFHQFTNTVVKRAEIFEKRIREAEEGQAKAMEAKLSSNKLLEQITRKQDIPDFVLRMLSKAWQHVLFLQQLKSEDEQSAKGLFFAKALLVSLQPISTFEETEKFLELQPILIEALKSNLEKTSYSFVEINAFLEELDAYHNDILINARSALEKGPTEEILRLKPTDNVFDTEGSSTARAFLEKPDFSKIDVRQWVEYNFDIMPETPVIETPDNDENKTRREKDKQASEKIIRMLKPGRWLMLNQNGKNIRCKLSSYIEANDKYIFVSGSGTKLAEYDSPQLIQAYQSKQVTILENTPLFERAFKGVINDLFDQYQIKQESQKEALQVSNEAQVDVPAATAENTDIKSETLSSINTHSKPGENNEFNGLNSLEERTNEAVTEITHTENKIKPLENELSQEDLDNLPRLAVGSWLEIKVGYKMTKCRLAAKISSTGKLIFTDRTGVKVKECFDKDLAQLYQNGELKLDEDHTLYDKAFTSVISNMRNLKAEKS